MCVRFGQRQPDVKGAAFSHLAKISQKTQRKCHPEQKKVISTGVLPNDSEAVCSGEIY